MLMGSSGHALLIICTLVITDQTLVCYGSLRTRLLDDVDPALVDTPVAETCNASTDMVPGNARPPVAVQKPAMFPNWGHRRQDNWAWLRDDRRQEPEVLQYLKEENTFTDLVLGGELADVLKEEMKARIASDDYSVPQRIDLFWYYSYRRPGDQYRVHCRRRLPEGSGIFTEDDVMDLTTAERVLLDENKEAEGHKYFDLGGFQVSADHKYLAYAVDTSGNESYAVYVKDIAEDTVKVVNAMHDASGKLAWGLDNRTLFYTSVTNETRRSNELWRWHVNSTAQAAQELIYTEPDEAFELSLTHTRSRKYILLYGQSEVTRYLLYLPAHNPTANFTVLGPKVQGRKYIHAADWANSWVLLVSDVQTDTLNAELLLLPAVNTTDLKQLGHNTTLTPSEAGHVAPNSSLILLPHSRDVELEDFDVTQRHLAVLKRLNGLSTAVTYTLPKEGQPLTGLAEGRTLEFEEESYSLSFGKQGPIESDVLRVVYSSFVTPESTFDFNMITGRRVLKKEQPVLGGFDKEQYRSLRLWAQSEGGVQVPVSLVHKKGVVRLDGSDPLLLYAYGAYGAAQDAEFDAERLSLLNRGFIYAIAHVRGGGDLGQYWYLDGKMLNKNNTFADLIAAAELLIAEGYTSPGRLCIWGRSAGGLTIGASINMRPELFQAAILDVPFVDVIATMSDPKLPLTITEYEEWGNPIGNETMYNYMLSYSPLDNVQRHPYPNMVVTGGLSDPRVPYWEPAKWVSKTRLLATNGPLIMLRENMAAGHFGSTGIFSSLHEIALKYAFLLQITCTAVSVSATAAKSEGSAVCIPCLAIFLVVMAGFGGLVAGSLYYGSSVLHGWRRSGKGFREVAMHTFNRSRDRNDVEEDETLDRRRDVEQENDRLIAEDGR